MKKSILQIFCTLSLISCLPIGERPLPKYNALIMDSIMSGLVKSGDCSDIEKCRLKGMVYHGYSNSQYDYSIHQASPGSISPIVDAVTKEKKRIGIKESITIRFFDTSYEATSAFSKQYSGTVRTI